MAETLRLERSYLHRGGTTALWGETIDTHFREIAKQHAGRDAVVSTWQKRRASYEAFDAEVQSVARGLCALGVEAGDRVGIWSTDNVEWVVLQMATARIGAVLVNINPAYRPAELEHALTLARIQALIMIPSFRRSDYVAMVKGLCAEAELQGPDAFRPARFPHLKRLVSYDPEQPEAPRPAKAFTTWAEMVARGQAIADEDVDARAAALDPDEPINIQFTSGTTGFPKAVVLTHHNLLNNAYFVAEAMRFTEQDRLCVPVPFYHCFGMVLANLACLTHGAAIVIPAPHFEPGATLAAVESERCTAVHGVPTMFVAELEHLRDHPCDLSSLRTGIMAGAPCPPELMRRVMSDLGCREILIAYGQTEASPVTHITAVDDTIERRTETVGTNLPHQEAKVIDPVSGALLPIGEQGEVCFRGYHVMRGYYDGEEATHAAIDEAGWLHSGDLGVMDESGYLRITGRLKDMIIRGGENIYPAEIEAFFFRHPKVSEIAVFGVPDPKMGEEVAAWVKPHEGESIDAEELRTWARGQIAHYKVPRFIRVVEEFPMTVTGKIQKFKMSEIEVAEREG